MKVRAIRNKILVTNIEKGERKTAGGIVIPDDDKKSEGVRARWAQIYDIGPDVKDEDLKPGLWILIEHGKWTRRMEVNEGENTLVLWGVEWPDPIIMVSDECPVEYAERFQ